MEESRTGHKIKETSRLHMTIFFRFLWSSKFTVMICNDVCHLLMLPPSSTFMHSNEMEDSDAEFSINEDAMDVMQRCLLSKVK